MGQPVGEDGPLVAHCPRLVTQVRRLGVVVSAGAVVVVLLVAFLLVYAAVVGLPRINQLHQGLYAVDGSHQARVDEQEALREFVTSSDQALLLTYRNAQQRVTVADADMQRLLDEPSLRSGVLDVLLTQQRWQHDWVDLAPDRGQLSPPDRTGFLRLGKALFDDYEGHYTSLRQNLVTALASAEATNNRIEWSVGAAILLVALVTLALALRGRRQLQRNVVAPVDNLLASMRDIEEGRLVPPAPVQGWAELTALRDGLADMTVNLRREREESAAHANRLVAQTDRLRTILVMAREIGGSLNTRYVSETTVQAVVRLTGGPVLLWMVNEEYAALELAHDSRRGPVLPADGERVDLGVGLVGRAAKYGQIARGEPAVDDPTGVAVPLVVGARVIGVLQCLGDGEREIDAAVVGAVELLATLAGAALEASRLHAATERLSQFDPLTQLANRRRLNADLAGAIAGARRHGHATALVMLDLDHFKQLNDRYGHPQGDIVLQEVATVLQAGLREGENAYRWGGEEFAVLVNIGDSADAERLSERLRERIEREFNRNGRQLVTASFGVAALPEDTEDAETLIAMADRALYVAKNTGRNRVVAARKLGE